MSDGFDPYQEWLGIQPDEQPADYYRLLGVRRFEEQLNVIENAADQRITHVSSVQSDMHSEHSQRILKELSDARMCLLTPGKKAAYDAQIRAYYNKQASSSKIKKALPMAKPLTSEPRQGDATANNSLAPNVPPAPVSDPLAPVSEMAQPAAPAAQVESTGNEAQPVDSEATTKDDGEATIRQPKKWLVPTIISGVSVVVLVVATILILNSQGGDDPGPNTDGGIAT
ncbi:MAG: hypothetical protein IH991_14185, partial [Planctomycetes bacterium]|nr:hypothetical protein [Planctomycetota bacterium]